MKKLMDDILSFMVSPGQLAVWWIGQSGFIFKTPEKKIVVIDAYLTNSAAKNRDELERLTPVLIKPEELVCDYYICTHNHTDHADPETIKSLKNKNSIIFIGPRNVVKLYMELGIPEKNIQLLEAGDSIKIGGITMTGTFCIPNSEMVLDSIGIIFQDEDLGIYHSGDTGYHPFLGYLSKYQVNMALLCINGKYGNMNYEEAFKLNEAISPGYAVPCHFDMFSINREDPVLFKRLFQQKRSETKCIIPETGKVILI